MVQYGKILNMHFTPSNKLCKGLVCIRLMVGPPKSHKQFTGVKRYLVVVNIRLQDISSISYEKLCDRVIKMLYEVDTSYNIIIVYIIKANS